MRVYNLIFEVNKPLNASFNGPALQLNQMYGYSVQVVWTGDMNGTLSLQASSDPNNTGIQPVNWTTITGSSTTISDDGGVSWVSVGTTLAAVASSTVTLTASNITAQQVRAIVTIAGTGVTAGYVLIKGF